MVDVSRHHTDIWHLGKYTYKGRGMFVNDVTVHYVWRLVVQRSPIFQSALGGRSSVLQLILSFHSPYLKNVLEMFFVSSQTHYSSNKHFMYCTSKFSWCHWRRYVTNAALSCIASSFVHQTCCLILTLTPWSLFIHDQHDLYYVPSNTCTKLSKSYNLWAV